MRGASVKFLCSALETHCINKEKTDLRELSEKIEREIFRQSRKLVNKTYRRLSRKVIFALKSEERSAEILSESVTVQDFVSGLNSNSCM